MDRKTEHLLHHILLFQGIKAVLNSVQKRNCFADNARHISNKTMHQKDADTDYREDTKTNKKSSERCNWRCEALCRESPLKGKKGGSLLVN